LLPPGVVHELELPNRIHTLLNPLLNHVAARAFYRKDEANVPIGLGRRAAEIGSHNSLGRKIFESDRGVEARLEYMREICRLDREGHCTTFFAHWLHEDPGHPKLVESLAKARASPLFADVLKPESVQEIADLYGPGTGAQAPATFEFASKLSDVYTRYYHHAAPFDPASLHRAWQRCAESDARCSERLDEMLAQGLKPELLTSR